MSSKASAIDPDANFCARVPFKVEYLPGAYILQSLNPPYNNVSFDNKTFPTRYFSAGKCNWDRYLVDWALCDYQQSFGVILSSPPNYISLCNLLLSRRIPGFGENPSMAGVSDVVSSGGPGVSLLDPSSTASNKVLKTVHSSTGDIIVIDNGTDIDLQASGGTVPSFRVTCDPSSNPDPNTGGLIVAANSGQISLPITTSISLDVASPYMDDDNSVFTLRPDSFIVNESGIYNISFSLIVLGKVIKTNPIAAQVIRAGQSLFTAPPAVAGITQDTSDISFVPGASLPYAWSVNGSSNCTLSAGDELILAMLLNNPTDDNIIQIVSNISCQKIDNRFNIAQGPQGPPGDQGPQGPYGVPKIAFEVDAATVSGPGTSIPLHQLGVSRSLISTVGSSILFVSRGYLNGNGSPGQTFTLTAKRFGVSQGGDPSWTGTYPSSVPFIVQMIVTTLSLTPPNSVLTARYINYTVDRYPAEIRRYNETITLSNAPYVYELECDLGQAGMGMIVETTFCYSI